MHFIYYKVSLRITQWQVSFPIKLNTSNVTKTEMKAGTKIQKHKDDEREKDAVKGRVSNMQKISVILQKGKKT